METRSVDVKITNPDGSIVFQQDGFEVPEFYSDRAATIIANKYAAAGETSAGQIVDRVVNQITQWGKEQGYFKGGNGHNDIPLPETFAKKLRDILINQRASFNSPVWFNCGVKENHPQMSACFIAGVEDNMEDILDHAKREGLIFKNGSGIGINISKLRAKGEPLSNKGQASGPISFMRGYDAFAGVIKSGGKTRRSAKLVCMNVDHPDILDFIECKKAEEEKAKILIANGIEPEEAYSTVDFQNANHSIRVTNEFMHNALNDRPWALVPRGGGEFKQVKAKDILRRAAEIAWETGDPGIQFDDRMNADNPVPSLGRINSTNPCSEFSAVDNSSCNLASFNLLKYLSDDNETFMWAEFRNDIRIMITAMDILVDPAYYPTLEIEEVTRKTRPLGLGYANLGALLMCMGYPYDSDRGREVAAHITKFMTTEAYLQSIELAKKLGPFAEYEAGALNYQTNGQVCQDIAVRLTGDPHIAELITKHKLRNSQLTLLAPTGTIAFMMDCDTTGIEPLFALQTFKTLAGGGMMKLVPDCVQRAIKAQAKRKSTSVDESLTIEDQIFQFPMEQQAIFDTANEISWKGHIDMMAAVQPYLNGAISKTVNLPKDATVEDVEDAYMYAWHNHLKALAIYRDGSKGMQPLSTKKTEIKKEPKDEKLKVIEKIVEVPLRAKMEETRDSKTHKFDIQGFVGYLTVGLYSDGRPGELFIRTSKGGSTMDGLMDSFAKAISFALQHGVPLETLVDKFRDTRFDPSGWTVNKDVPVCSSVIDYIFKWLDKNFLQKDNPDLFDDEENGNSTIPPAANNYDGSPCIYCGGITQKNGTCEVCISCGTTTGCG